MFPESRGLLTENDRSSSGEEEDHERWGECRKSFQKDFNGEQWIQCLPCSAWFHKVPVSSTEYDPNFIFDDCSVQIIAYC